jgi:hypothetical protein
LPECAYPHWFGLLGSTTGRGVGVTAGVSVSVGTGITTYRCEEVGVGVSLSSEEGSFCAFTKEEFIINTERRIMPAYMNLFIG